MARASVTKRICANQMGRAFCSRFLQVYMLMRLDRELELDFIREFAVGGELLGGSNGDDRRERIRVAIYGHNLVHAPFRDSGMDYAQAYESCYGRPIEMRRTVRHEPKLAEDPDI
jgi:hypothetical protein